MIYLNGKSLYEAPTSCGVCPFFFNGSTDSPLPQQRQTVGNCLLFDEWHRCYRNVPRRCEKLFKKAMTFPVNSDLIIMAKE